MARLSSFLPRALMSLILIIPLPGLRSASVNNTCHFHDFYHLRPIAQEPYPTCSLSSVSFDPAPDVLSFEDWKARQLSIKDHANAAKSANQTAEVDDTPNLPRVHATLTPVPSGGGVQPLDPTPRQAVPIVNRFNYASLDCTARIHATHKGAKYAPSILSSKKDKYMLSPCSASKKFVVVELCDEIRIDTIQLANFEFFSGVFKDFRVSVAQSYSSDNQGWSVVSDYRAKNIRGVQSFHTPRSLTAFYRFIRIDFLTHYSLEYYCPVSLLRVYGLTQLEDVKSLSWDEPIDQTESAEEVIEEKAPPPIQIGQGSDLPAEADTITINEKAPDEQLHPLEKHISLIPVITLEPPATLLTKPTRTRLSTTSENASHRTNSHDHFSVTTPEATMETSPFAEHSSAPETTASSLEPSPTTAFVDTSSAVHDHPSASADAEGSHPARVKPSAVTVSLAPSPTALIPGGESIYRTIMNRITSLEYNTTLYNRYVEEQTRALRETLRKLEEDVGRLEGITKSQQQSFHRVLEKQRKDMDDVRIELLSKVNSLADEVILEKRLGIAQLCLLLTVLIFMALTRGSRGEVPLWGPPINVRQLGSRASAAIRNSGDWAVSRGGPSGPRVRAISSPTSAIPPSATPQTPIKTSHRANATTQSSSARSPGTSTPRGPGPSTPMRSPRPFSNAVGRSSSQHTPGALLPAARISGPVRRLARTAHLHEVQATKRHRLLESVPASEATTGKGKARSRSNIESEADDNGLLPSLHATPKASARLPRRADEISSTEDGWGDESDADQSVANMSPPEDDSNREHAMIASVGERLQTLALQSPPRTRLKPLLFSEEDGALLLSSSA